MKNIFFSLLLIVCLSSIVQGQQTQKINDYSLGEKDLVFLPFGMDQKIVIGKVDAEGSIHMDFSSFDISGVKNTGLYLGDFSAGFDVYCDEETIEKGSMEDVEIVNAGELYIYNETHWEGALIAASSKELYDHLLDNYGKDAVIGKYLKWYYSSKDAQYSSTCLASQFFFGGKEVKQKKVFELDLKAGWNMILFDIKEVVPVQDAAAMATDIHISTTEDYPEDLTWFLKKF